MADQNSNIIPGQQNSGQKVNGQAQTFWNGASTPTGMQVNVDPAAHSQGQSSIDPRAQGYNQSLAQQYQNQANGVGPSLAQMQLQQGNDAAIKGQAALAASGHNAASNSYNALQNAGSAMQQNAGQAAQTRLQEQYQAQQGLAGVTNQMQNAYGQNAQLGQQNNQFNASQTNGVGALQAQINAQQNQAYNGMMAGQQGQYNAFQDQGELAQNAADNQLRNGLVSKGADAAAGVAQAAGSALAMSDERQKEGVQPGGNMLQSFMDKIAPIQQAAPLGALADDGSAGKAGQALGQGLTAGGPGATADAGTSTGAMAGSAMGPGMSAGAAGYGAGIGAGALSDARMKQEVKPGGSTMSGFLDKLKAHEYRYKDPSMPGASEGKHYSVMAQELEKAGPVGESMIDEQPNGTKMVNYGRGLGAMLAIQADQHQRIKKLEGK